MQFSTNRRTALASIGAGLVAGGLSQSAEAAANLTLAAAGGRNLHEFATRLAELPRRRDYKTVPMIADKPDLWDKAALDLLMGYKGPRQVWDHTDLTGPWLNGMRNTLNGQIYAFNQPDFLCVSGTHGPAHLALYDQPAWDKYQLAKNAGGNVTSNTFIVVPPAASHDPSDIQSPDGAFSPKANNVVVLQRRGVVFLACHNAIWELASALVAANQNPDHLSVDDVAADLTNHLIPDVVLTPGVVPTLVTLAQLGFIYTR
jgi:hypothetical protein